MEGRNILDPIVREDGPELVLDELGHFFSEEVGVFGGGAVATPLDAGVKFLGGPRFGGGECGHTMVSPFAEQFGSGVVDLIQFGS